MLKDFIKQYFKQYFGEQRIAMPAMLLVGALTILHLVLWRLHIQPVIYEPYFYLGATLAAFVGYYLTKDSCSKVVLALSAPASVALLFVYAYCLDAFTEVTLLNLILLGALYCVGIGGIFSALRILLNLGLH
jgi:hypothetical protein